MAQKIKLKRILGFFSVAPIITFVSSCSFISNYSSRIAVDEVLDGDTFKSGKNKYRLLGIDTPETYDPSNDFESTTGPQYFYGTSAKNKAKELLLSNYVEIETTKKDKYNRFVSKVNVNGIDFSSYMIENGYAVVRYISSNKNSQFYYYDSNYIQNLYDLQDKARQAKKGFWCEPISTLRKIFPS